MARDTQERQALAYLREVGAEVLEVTRKRHVKIRWRLHGRRRLTVMPASTSDSKRGALNMLAGLRRQVQDVSAKQEKLP